MAELTFGEKLVIARRQLDLYSYQMAELLGVHPNSITKYERGEGKPPRVLRTKEVGIEVMPGDCFEVRSAGGGGWGVPEKRAVEARARDRVQGLVSGVEKAS